MAKEVKERTKRSSNDPALIAEKATALSTEQKVELIKLLKAQVLQESEAAAAKSAQLSQLTTGL